MLEPRRNASRPAGRTASQESVHQWSSITCCLVTGACPEKQHEVVLVVGFRRVNTVQSVLTKGGDHVTGQQTLLGPPPSVGHR